MGQGVTLPNSKKIEATKFHCCHGFGKVALSDFLEKGLLKPNCWCDQGTRCNDSNNFGDHALGEVSEGLSSNDQLNSS